MTLEEKVQSNTDRIAALEARQPSAHDTKETNPFKDRGPKSEPHQDPDEDFLKVFGRVRTNEGRVLDKWEEQTWNRRLKSWGGFAVTAPESVAVDALVETYKKHLDLELKPETIIYGGEAALVFPTLNGLGYGTPKCFVLLVSLIEKDFGIEQKIDLSVDLIEQRRTKE